MADAVLAAKRQEAILEQVRLHGAVRVSDLVDQLGVSDMTVRRDIAVLARAGLVQRVHGGATSCEGRMAEEPGFAAESEQQTDEKKAIATVAASLVEPGSSVALSGGTTTFTVATALKGTRDLVVVTNSLPVADVLHEPERHDRSVVLTGGERTRSDALVGAWAVAALRGIHVDWAIVGAYGLDEQAGLTTPSLVEAETDRALIAAGRRVVFVVDSSKWQTVGLRTIATLDEVDVLITDSGLPEPAREALAPLVGELMIASVPDRRTA